MRDYLNPMGVLSQAKNGDEQFWKQKFHAANGKAQHAPSSAVLYFLLSFGFGGRGGFFSFFLCSQHVPLKFSMDSHQVPDMFPRFPMCSPMVFPTAPGFNHPICFAESPPLLTYIVGQRARYSIFPQNLLYLGSLHSFNFFFSYGPIKLAHCKRKKSWPCDTPQLITMKTE